MALKYAVFDWDGTLANTYPVISAAYDYTFDRLGLPRIPYDEVKRITSTLQNKDTLGHIFGARKEEAGAAFYDYITRCHLEKLEAMPGARELLEFCRRAGLRCFLITNKKTRFIAEELKKLGFAEFFEKVVAAGEYAEDKPHPLACHAVFGGNLPPAAEIAVIGDGEADVKTARCYDNDGGRATCIIYDSKKKYRGAEPDYKITSLSEAIDIIGGAR